jgi:NADH-quinone oxidoreductase subunit E
MQMFRATAKLDPETIAQVGNGFWQKWQETVTDMADTARQSVGAKSVADVFTAQIGFGMRNAERWTQWSSPAADLAAAMEPEAEVEPEPEPVPAEPKAEAAVVPPAATCTPSSDDAETSADIPYSAPDEPTPVVAAPVPAPAAVEAQTAQAAPATAPAVDDLTRIRGIGPAIERKLHARGVTSFQQIADLSGDALTALDDALDFRGRIERDEWVEQAQKLAQR